MELPVAEMPGIRATSADRKEGNARGHRPRAIRLRIPSAGDLATWAEWGSMLPKVQNVYLLGFMV